MKSWLQNWSRDIVFSFLITGLIALIRIIGLPQQFEQSSQSLDYKTFSNALEYFIVPVGGLIGMLLARWQRKPSLHLFLLISSVIAWVICCYILLIVGWRVSVTPVAETFFLNAVLLYPFYQKRRQLEIKRQERQQLIDWTYNTIHNGPLQVIAKLLSTWPEDEPAPTNTRRMVLHLNQELRDVYQTLRQEMLRSSDQLVMSNQYTISLKYPLRDILYETYKTTLERHSDFFQKVVQITIFESIDDSSLTEEQKRSLCRFLEESLINVYKHAKNVTRITVACRQEDRSNTIYVIDNGSQGHPSEQQVSRKGGDGTRQAKQLARQLGGQFRRMEIMPQGVRCELRWPIRSSSIWKSLMNLLTNRD
ncbi:MAG: hypothetical protein AAF703_17330 [Cyanobacteria bacterium P01_D01_bin.105]